MTAHQRCPFPMITLDGDPFERGVRHGELASDRIARSLAFYGDVVAEAAGIAFGGFCDSLVARFPAWRTAEPELAREIEGIANGSRRSVGEILALNARASLVGQVPAGADACTSFAITAAASRDGHVYAGQNWDYLAGIADTLVLLHVRPAGGPRYLTLVEAGQLARYGASEAGFSFNANGLSSTPHDPEALPWPFIRRRALASATLHDAVKAVAAPRSQPDSSNLLLVDRSGLVVDLEVEPARLRWVEPARGVLVHTNHYLAEVPVAIRETYSPDPDSLLRYLRARQLLAEAVDGGGVTRSDLVALTSDHAGGDTGICMHWPADAGPTDRWQTVATVIADLTAGRMWVGAGLPCQRDLVELDVASGEVLGPALLDAA